MNAKFQREVITDKDVIFFSFRFRDQVRNLCTKSPFALSPSVSMNMYVWGFSFLVDCPEGTGHEEIKTVQIRELKA